MTTIPLAAPRRRGSALRDSWLVAVRDMSHWVREPQIILWGALFPVVSVILFAFVFGSGMTVPGQGDYQEFLMPGVFAQAMAFGVGETIAAVQADTAKGVTDRLRSMPLSPIAVVAGRCIANTIYSSFTLVLLALTGLAVGWSWSDGILAALGAFGLLLLLRIAFLWIGIVLGLKAKSAETANSIFGLLWPITILSNAFTAPELMPKWLGTVAEWNPISSTVTACRELFGNPAGTSTSWIAENALLMAIVWPLIITAITFPLAVRTFQRLSR
jgi:ABC-2 type transport system permease protein